MNEEQELRYNLLEMARDIQCSLPGYKRDVEQIVEVAYKLEQYVKFGFYANESDVVCVNVKDKEAKPKK